MALGAGRASRKNSNYERVAKPFLLVLPNIMYKNQRLCHFIQILSSGKDLVIFVKLRIDNFYIDDEFFLFFESRFNFVCF
jgi:hypothetical protein